MKRFRTGLGTFAMLAAVTYAHGASAQVAQGFALERIDVSERGSEWFASDSLDLRGSLRPVVGVVTDYARRPLVLYGVDGSTRAALVRDQLVVHPGASVNLWSRARLAFDMPIAAFQDGDAGTANGVTYPAGNTASAGDLRLGADVRLVGRYGEPFTIAAGTQLFVPTGKESTYTSDGARLLPRVQASGTLGAFTYALGGGFLFHANRDSFGAYPRGNEVTFDAALGVRVLGDRLLLGPELFGGTVVSGASAPLGTHQTPIEALFDVRGKITEEWRVAVGGGPGLTRGLGEPAFRALVAFEWTPVPHETSRPALETPPEPPPIEIAPLAANEPAPPADEDHDGVPDTEDACPQQPGMPTTDLASSGCPDAFVRDEEIHTLGRIEFATASSAIDPADETQSVLADVAALLRANPAIAKVRVEGHTDAAGDPRKNKVLSEKRAAAVVAWLVNAGIARERLTSEGLGQDRPIADNATDDGRRRNRRVEFHLEHDDEAGAAGAAKTTDEKRSVR